MEKLEESLFDFNGKTVVIAGSSSGMGYAACELLLKLGARHDDTDNEGLTPLMLAATRGDWRKLEHLAAAGANLDARDRDGV